MCDWSPQASGEGSGYEEPRSPQATGEKPRMTVWNNFEFIILLFYFKKVLTTSTCCRLFSSMTLSEVSFMTLLSALILLGTWYWNIMFYHFLIGKLCKTIKSRYEAVRRRMKKTVFPEGVSKQPIDPCRQRLFLCFFCSPSHPSHASTADVSSFSRWVGERSSLKRRFKNCRVDIWKLSRFWLVDVGTKTFTLRVSSCQTSGWNDHGEFKLGFFSQIQEWLTFLWNKKSGRRMSGFRTLLSAWTVRLKNSESPDARWGACALNISGVSHGRLRVSFPPCTSPFHSLTLLFPLSYFLLLPILFISACFLYFTVFSLISPFATLSFCLTHTHTHTHNQILQTPTHSLPAFSGNSHADSNAAQPPSAAPRRRLRCVHAPPLAITTG